MERTEIQSFLKDIKCETYYPDIESNGITNCQKLFEELKSHETQGRIEDCWQKVLIDLLMVRKKFEESNIPTTFKSIVSLLVKCTQIENFYQLPFGQLTTFINDVPYSDRMNIEKLWAEAKPIRKLLLEFKLDLNVSDILEKEGIQEVSDKKLKEMLPKFTENTKRVAFEKFLYYISDERRSEIEKRQAKRYETGKKKESLKKLISPYIGNKSQQTPRDSVILSEIGTLTVNLSNILEVNGLSESELSTNIANLEEQLQTWETHCLEEFRLDEEVIASACRSLAMRGLCVGDFDQLLYPPLKQLLAKPSLTTCQESKEKPSEFFITLWNSQHRDQFIALVQTAGWVQALDLFKRLLLTEPHSGIGRERWVLKSKFCCVVQCNVFPVKNFTFLPQLSDEAILDLKQIRSEEAAKKFLADCGSHIFTGDHVLGGIVIQTVEITSPGVEVPTDVLEKAALSALKEKGKILNSVPHSVELKDHPELQGTKTNYFLGPYSATLPLFQSILEVNNRAWAVISQSQLVPIWDYLTASNFPNHLFVGKLLRSAWQNQMLRFIQSQTTTVQHGGKTILPPIAAVVVGLLAQMMKFPLASVPDKYLFTYYLLYCYREWSGVLQLNLFPHLLKNEAKRKEVENIILSEDSEIKFLKMTLHARLFQQKENIKLCGVKFSPAAEALISLAPDELRTKSIQTVTLDTLAQTIREDIYSGEDIGNMSEKVAELCSAALDKNHPKKELCLESLKKMDYDEKEKSFKTPLHDAQAGEAIAQLIEDVVNSAPKPMHKSPSFKGLMPFDLPNIPTPAGQTSGCNLEAFLNDCASAIVSQDDKKQLLHYLRHRLELKQPTDEEKDIFDENSNSNCTPYLSVIQQIYQGAA
jgi:hypothetical protein